MANDLDEYLSSLDDFEQALMYLGNTIYQTSANNQQRADTYYFYNDQKNWNSPSNQMALRRVAGLSPYGNFQVGNVNQPNSVNLAQGIPELASSMMGSLSQSAARKMQSISQRLAFKQLELQEKQTDAGIKFTEQQIEQLKSSTVYQDLVNYITDATKDSQIQLSSRQVEYLLSQILTNNVNLDFLPEMLQSQIRKNNSEADSTDYMYKTYYPAWIKVQQDLAASGISLNSQNASKIAAEIQKLTADKDNAELMNFGLKEFKKSVEQMKDGVGKTILLGLIALLQSGVFK